MKTACVHRRPPGTHRPLLCSPMHPLLLSNSTNSLSMHIAFADVFRSSTRTLKVGNFNAFNATWPGPSATRLALKSSSMYPGALALPRRPKQSTRIARACSTTTHATARCLPTTIPSEHRCQRLTRLQYHCRPRWLALALAPPLRPPELFTHLGNNIILHIIASCRFQHTVQSAHNSAQHPLPFTRPRDRDSPTVPDLALFLYRSSSFNHLSPPYDWLH